MSDEVATNDAASEKGESLALARDAAARADWSTAYDLYQPLLEAQHVSAADLDAFASAAWWTGHLTDCMTARERAYARHLQEGNPRRAGLTALNLSRDYRATLSAALANGWFANAERLLAGDEPSPERGWLLRELGHHALETGDIESAIDQAAEVIEYGNRFNDRSLEIVGQHERGLALLASGETDEGLRLLDASMASAVSGELDPFWTGVIYCNLISACRDIADYRRAGDWTDVAERWCKRQSITGFPGICRVRRGEITRLRGAWAEAEQQLRAAADELSTHYVHYAGAAFYEIGEIRLRMGDLEAARQALFDAHALGEHTEPAMSLLHLAEGNARAAASGVRRALAETSSPALRARLLPAAVEILVAVDAIDDARNAAAELESIAQKHNAPAFWGAAHAARATVDLAKGDAASALEHLTASIDAWRQVDAPYESARARLLLAGAHRAMGDHEAAEMESEVARSSLERLGANLELITPPPRPAAPTEPTVATKTFMFTDIVGSTQLVAAIGDGAWADLRDWHDRTIASLVETNGGTVIKATGDGFFLAFDSGQEALSCALAIQRTFAEHRRTHGFAPRLRIGVHAARATTSGDDYAGMGVNQAARIGDQAEAGEILVSVSTLEGDTLGGVTSPPRLLELKGIPEPVAVVSVAWE